MSPQKLDAGSSAKDIVASILLLVISIALAAAIGETILRLKNSSMRNYDIEMWRYAKELKVRSPDPELDFVHRTSKVAVLQNVVIRTNEMGLRGGPLESTVPPHRRILFLGGSITLGWGVKEDETVTARVEQMLKGAGEHVEVLNGGVGNYNASRYVSHFLKDLKSLDPTDIVIHYFLRDAEDLQPGGDSFLLRHSELAVTLWIAYHHLFDRQGEQSLIDHYKAVYEPDVPGYRVMIEKLEALAEYAKTTNIRVILAMVPDIHNLVDYKFGFIHEKMRTVARDLGFEFVDLLPIMKGRRPEELWAMSGDPHPNALGHQLMAEALFPVLSSAKGEPN